MTQEPLNWLIPFVDGIVVYYVIYRLLLLIKGTRAIPSLIGLATIMLAYIFTKENFLGLFACNWLLSQLVDNFLIVLVILFQSDIRRALAAVGDVPLLNQRFRSSEDSQVIDELVKATSMLAEKKIGALIAIERRGSLMPYLRDETVRLNARLTKELLYTIFIPECQNPLHDGAVYVRDGRIQAAAVFLPMTVNPSVDLTYGTRHRAALGLVEETDAVVLVVSEERGVVSVACDGKIMPCGSPSEVRQHLSELLLAQPVSRLFSLGSLQLLSPSNRGDAKKRNKKKAAKE